MAQYFARIQSGAVAEVIQIPDGAKIADYFTPVLVATMVPANATITPLMTWDGQSFGPVPVPIPPVVLTPAQVAQALLNDQQATSVVLRGLIVLLAQKLSMTQGAVVSAIVAAAN